MSATTPSFPNVPERRYESFDPKPIHWVMALTTALALLCLAGMLAFRPDSALMSVPEAGASLSGQTLQLRLARRQDPGKGQRTRAATSGRTPDTNRTINPASPPKQENKSITEAVTDAKTKPRLNPRPKKSAIPSPAKAKKIPAKKAMTKPAPKTRKNVSASRNEAVPSAPNKPTQSIESADAAVSAPNLGDQTIGQATEIDVAFTAASPSAPTTTAISPVEKQAYQQLLVDRITAEKRYPALAARQQLEGEVVLKFAISKAGALLTPAIHQSSGHLSLDNAALAMLDRASPLPAPPPGFRSNDLRFTIPIGFNLN